MLIRIFPVFQFLKWGYVKILCPHILLHNCKEKVNCMSSCITTASYTMQVHLLASGGSINCTSVLHSINPCVGGSRHVGGGRNVRWRCVWGRRVLKPQASLIDRLVACSVSARINTHTQRQTDGRTDRPTNYSNPRCTCAQRVNKGEMLAQIQQWNLRKRGTTGQMILFLVERSSQCRRSNNTLKY